MQKREWLSTETVSACVWSGECRQGPETRKGWIVLRGSKCPLDRGDGGRGTPERRWDGRAHSILEPRARTWTFMQRAVAAQGTSVEVTWCIRGISGPLIRDLRVGPGEQGR